jgi:hypothetical protein
VSLFRLFKYSSILFFLGKYKSKLFRVVAVLLFALITSLLYQDVADYLQQQYPETVIYALITKIIIVYGAMAFVLLQFRPTGDDKSVIAAETPRSSLHKDKDKAPPADRLAQLKDIEKKTTLRNRYDKVVNKSKDNQV